MEHVREQDVRAEVPVPVELSRLRTFDGTPAEFWHRYLSGCARLVGASLAVLMVRQEDDKRWRSLLAWPSDGKPGLSGPWLAQSVEETARTAAENGDHVDDSHLAKRGVLIVGARLEIEESGTLSVAVLVLEKAGRDDAGDAVVRLRLVADVPAVYQQARSLRSVQNDVARYGEALDVMVLLNAETRFKAAAMVLANETAHRYGCDRVSLGWLQRGRYVRLQVLSHAEHFDKKMDAVQELETAMEEAFDQDEEIVWPRPEGNRAVVRDHQAYAGKREVKHMVSLPVRVDDEPAGVLSCERASAPFSEHEVRGLRVLLDQAARRLGDLERRDRWFGARMVRSTRDTAAKLVGADHTFAKLLGIVGALVLAFLLFGHLPYRVEAPFILKSDDLAYVPAPFEGYIDEVYVDVGDAVEKGDLLLTLDTRELLLEEAAAIAGEIRYTREAEKARAENKLAEMRIARAMQEQATARLKLVQHKLAHSRLLAPFEGVVAEGELKELLGAPVRKGDVLFKVARLDTLYAELDVDERDVHEIPQGATGHIAFVSRPEKKFPVTVSRVDPVATVKDEGNVFAVRAEPGAPDPWWRPGMSGVAKIDVGDRNVLWILTHRTVDFLQIFLWW